MAPPFSFDRFYAGWYFTEFCNWCDFFHSNFTSLSSSMFNEHFSSSMSSNVKTCNALQNFGNILCTFIFSARSRSRMKSLLAARRRPMVLTTRWWHEISCYMYSIVYMLKFLMDFLFECFDKYHFAGEHCWQDPSQDGKCQGKCECYYYILHYFHKNWSFIWEDKTYSLKTLQVRMPDGMRIRKKEKGEGGESREEKSKLWKREGNTFVPSVENSHFPSEERSSEKKEKRREKQKSESRSNNYIKEDAEWVFLWISFKPWMCCSQLNIFSLRQQEDGIRLSSLPNDPPGPLHSPESGNTSIHQV